MFTARSFPHFFRVIASYILTMMLVVMIIMIITINDDDSDGDGIIALLRWCPVRINLISHDSPS